MKKLPLSEIYDRDAEELLLARKTGRLLHLTGDIDASGDELEIPVRDFLRKRLPEKYYVGHGHIVDSQLNVSAQFDIIIADASSTPILFDGKNGTEYFPYESVYAVGEIKSTYNKYKNQVDYFSSSVRKVKTEMYRADVPKSYIGHGIELGEMFQVSKVNDVRNKLFTFMVFGNKGNFSTENIETQLSRNTKESNPYIMCFLDGSVVTQLATDTNGTPVKSYVFEPWDPSVRGTVLSKLDFTNTSRSGTALATLMMSLSSHLSKTLLKPPPLTKYMDVILGETSAIAEFVDNNI